MPEPITALAVGVLIQAIQAAIAARNRGDTLTDEQRHLADLAEEESFQKLAAATGHGADVAGGGG